MTSTQSKVDLELKKAFQDLQSKKIEAMQKLRAADVQVDFHRQIAKRCELTKQELASLPADSVTYDSVGRMFVKQSVSDALKHLDDKYKAAEEKTLTLESSKMYLEKSIKESEDNLREMVLAKKTSS
uniref:Prefoldin subunit 1 n=1 Tax=Romanomermis culicivorax TaxID=13658 RepID=A0A915KQV5_ROMCU